MTTKLTEAGQRRFAELRDVYCRSLGQKLSELRSCNARLTGSSFEPHALDALRQLSHRLAGSAAPYGFPAVSSYAAALESRILQFPVSAGSRPEWHAALQQDIHRLCAALEEAEREEAESHSTGSQSAGEAASTR
jgi:HPt (histidine-containing phosphotransfer) domain-containing protein